MAQRDYLMRMIEQMGQVLIRLRRMLAGELSGGGAFRQHLDEAATRFGITPVLLHEATPETLAMLLAPTVDPSRCWLGAELLFLEALAAEAEERPADAVAAYEKARLLFRLIEPAGALLVGWPEAAGRIEAIQLRLAALDGSGGGPG